MPTNNRPLIIQTPDLPSQQSPILRYNDPSRLFLSKSHNKPLEPARSTEADPVHNSYEFHLVGYFQRLDIHCSGIKDHLKLTLTSLASRKTIILYSTSVLATKSSTTTPPALTSQDVIANLSHGGHPLLLSSHPSPLLIASYPSCYNMLLPLPNHPLRHQP